MVVDCHRDLKKSDHVKLCILSQTSIDNRKETIKSNLSMIHTTLCFKFDPLILKQAWKILVVDLKSKQKIINTLYVRKKADKDLL